MHRVRTKDKDYKHCKRGRILTEVELTAEDDKEAVPVGILFGI